MGTHPLLAFDCASYGVRSWDPLIKKRFEKADLKYRGLPEPSEDQRLLRIAPKPIENNNERPPSNPMSGNRLPVFGSSDGAARTGAGPAAAIRIGISAGGAATGGGGGGNLPETCCDRVT